MIMIKERKDGVLYLLTIRKERKDEGWKEGEGNGLSKKIQ